MKTFIPFSLVILLSTAAAAQTPASSPVGTSGRTSLETSADYRLVPGDKLRIEVYKDAQLSQSLQVRPDGKITLPLAGDIVAAGRTPTQLRDSISNSLKTYITNPTVTVIVVETVPPVFYVMGEVRTPGTFPLNGELTVVQALAVAGGFTEFANKSNITIKRGTQSINFNYKDAIKSEGKPMIVRPGDTIIIK